jgi:hypothetical protein
MAKPMLTYLHDHLAGARFAVSLLQDLSDQKVDSDVAQCAARLLPAIDEDRTALEAYMKRIGDDGSMVKDIAAWITQKASRFKLALHDPFGLFEAIEMLSLGVLGKIALWNALKSLRDRNDKLVGHNVTGLDLDQLISRARDQHQQLESLRLRLAVETLAAQPQTEKASEPV